MNVYLIYEDANVYAGPARLLTIRIPTISNTGRISGKVKKE